MLAALLEIPSKQIFLVPGLPLFTHAGHASDFGIDGWPGWRGLQRGKSSPDGWLSICWQCQDDKEKRWRLARKCILRKRETEEGRLGKGLRARSFFFFPSLFSASGALDLHLHRDISQKRIPDLWLSLGLQTEFGDLLFFPCLVASADRIKFRQGLLTSVPPGEILIVQLCSLL